MIANSVRVENVVTLNVRWTDYMPFCLSKTLNISSFIFIFMVKINKSTWLLDDELSELATLKFKRGNVLNRTSLTRSELDDYFLKV